MVSRIVAIPPSCRLLVPVASVPRRSREGEGAMMLSIAVIGRGVRALSLDDAVVTFSCAHPCRPERRRPRGGRFLRRRREKYAAGSWPLLWDEPADVFLDKAAGLTTSSVRVRARDLDEARRQCQRRRSLSTGSLMMPRKSL